MRLVVIDAANTLYRAFFAIPPLRTADGVPTNAAYGFTNMLLKVIREEKPDALAVVFDAPGKSFRHRLYRDYKATRDAQPEDLTTQFALVRELIDAYRIPVIEIPDVEADDVIATLVHEAPADAEVAVISTDKDLMQLVNEHVVLLDTMKDRRFGPAEVEERFGVPPSQLVDARALVGYPSDNIPGVKGICEKGAAKLIREWGSLEEVLAHTADVKAKRAREALEEQADTARLSKELATLKTDVELPAPLAELRPGEPDLERLRDLFTRLEFTRRLDALEGGAAGGQAEAAPTHETRSVGPADYATLAAELADVETLALVPVEGGRGEIRPRIVGVAFAAGPGSAAYVPLGDGDRAGFLEAFGPLLCGAGARPWLGRDTKRVQVAFAALGLDLPTPVFDTEVAAFRVDPAAQRTTAVLAQQHLGRSVPTWESVAGRGAKASAAEELPVDAVAAWAGEEVLALAELASPLADRLRRDGLEPLFEEVELPLTSVLARMEDFGVRVDEAVLGQLSQEYESELSRIEGEIYALAGEKFLISSPKQLQHILFDKLKLPVVKKTKTGFSTDESVLVQLAHHHDLPAQILAHRRLAKLKSTYVDALPPLVDAKTGRIHPTFNQTGAATGRLSSNHPNVQNIPIRTEEGIRIREAFVPGEGRRLLSADYSQVELRILAHFSEDENLLEAFAAGEDIHASTAAEVAGIEPDEVTPDQRARAKAINFGIIYGSSAFGIANQLGIATAEAQETIDAYFERFAGVRRFLDATIAEAKQEGYVRTLLDRRRYLPDLRSRNRVLRQAAERMAVNTVIQGTAADLIKKAMVELDQALEADGRGARMILQVHDELVLEVPKAELEAVSSRVRQIMEGVYALRVPLLVELGIGDNWREAH